MATGKKTAFPYGNPFIHGYAGMCRNMRNKQLAVTILEKMRQGKSNKQISLELQKHRNTVSNYVKWLRNNDSTDPKLLSNMAGEELKHRIPTMENNPLVTFYCKLNPQITKIQSEHKETVETTVRKELVVNFDELSKTARRKLLEAEEALTKAENKLRQG